jgi:hypothetical protein
MRRMRSTGKCYGMTTRSAEITALLSLFTHVCWRMDDGGVRTRKSDQLIVLKKRVQTRNSYLSRTALRDENWSRKVE